MTRPTAIVADDHAIVIEGLRYVMSPHVEILTTCSNGEDLLEATRRLRPDIVIADISMPRMSGLQFLRAIQPDSVRPQVILLSMYGDAETVEVAMRSGALGYVTKQAMGEELFTAVHSVLRGVPYVSSGISSTVAAGGRSADAAPRVKLSTRQREVLELVAAGKRMKEIAAALRLSRRTVEMHKYQVMRVIGVRTTAELISYFVRHETDLPVEDRAGR